MVADAISLFDAAGVATSYGILGHSALLGKVFTYSLGVGIGVPPLARGIRALGSIKMHRWRFGLVA